MKGIGTDRLICFSNIKDKSVPIEEKKISVLVMDRNVIMSCYIKNNEIRVTPYDRGEESLSAIREQFDLMITSNSGGRNLVRSKFMAWATGAVGFASSEEMFQCIFGKDPKEVPIEDIPGWEPLKEVF